MYFKQCEMQKPLGKTVMHQTAWIPEHLAHVGHIVKTHIQGEVWSDGWKITAVGVRQSAEYVSSHERDHYTQAQASDAVRDSNGHWKKLGQ
jgi:hypothetical protein